MKHTFLKTLLSAAVLGAMSNGAFAAGTTAGVSIVNTATISYKVGTVVQTPIKSSPTGNSTPGTAGEATTFLVDKKVDLTVTAGTPNPVPVTPGAQTQAITFTVSNTGNSNETFTMTPAQVTTSAIDTFDTTGCTVLPASKLIIADAIETVTVKCNIPPSSTTVKNGAKSQVSLTAKVGVGATDVNTADNKDTVEVVYADSAGSTDIARGGQHSAVNTYLVGAADLKVTKTSAVISDPSNGTTNPKRIPGAVIEYTITVENPAGGADAKGIVINDALEGNLTFVSCLQSGDGITGCSETGNAVTTPVFTLTGGQTATLKIKATVN